MAADPADPGDLPADVTPYRQLVTTGAGGAAREISDRYLPDDERARATAEQTGRSPSTISRVLRRNQDPGSGQHRPFTAPLI